MSAFFSKADIHRHPFRLSPNVCFRPEADIRGFLILRLYGAKCLTKPRHEQRWTLIYGILSFHKEMNSSLRDAPNFPHQGHSSPMSCDQFFYSAEIRQICRRYQRQNGAIKYVTESDRFKVMLLKKMDEL